MNSREIRKLNVLGFILGFGWRFNKKILFCRWVVLFSHPADFTPVCTTELGRMAVHDHEFKKRGVKIIAHSCDKLQSHVDWVNVSKVK